MSRDHNAFGYSSGSSWRNAGQTQRNTSTSITYRPIYCIRLSIYNENAIISIDEIAFVMRIKRRHTVNRQQTNNSREEKKRTKILRALIYQPVCCQFIDEITLGMVFYVFLCR